MSQESPASSPHQSSITGLNTQQVAESRSKHGSNILTPPERESWWTQWLSKFDDPVIRILIIAAVLAIVAGIPDHHYVEGIAIILAVLLATTLAFINEYKAGKEFDILNKVNDDIPIKVIREGKYTSVSKRDIVVGDVVLIEIGEELPCDGEVLEATSLQIDESRLTGESVPVEKSPKGAHGSAPKEASSHEAAYTAEKLLRGTIVVDGHGLFTATAVGDHTEIGKTARAASEESDEETPLNAQLERLSKVIGVVGLGIAALTYVALVIQAVFSGKASTPKAGAGEWSDSLKDVSNDIVAAVATHSGNPLANMTGAQWFFAVVLMISALAALAKVWLPIVLDGLELLGKEVKAPAWVEEEGILPWIKTFLAGLVMFGMVIGAAVLLKKLPSTPSEWLPLAAGKEFLTFFMIAVTIIVVAVPEGLAMSVTLSLAYSMRRMTATNNLVRRMHACETIGAATVICSDKTGTLTMNEMRVYHMQFPGLDPSAPKIDTSLPITGLVSEAISSNSTANLDTSDPAALKVMGNPTEGAMILWLRDRGVDYLSERAKFKVTRQWTFSTERKFMGTLGASPSGNAILHTKGAPEIILNRCDRVLTDSGLVPLADKKDAVLAAMKQYQIRGMRTLGLAYHDSPVADDELEKVAVGMVWLGFIAIQDPVRPEVPDAIEACRKAGIEVKMVTGDNPDTAREIGRQIGLIDPNTPDKGQLTGTEFNALDDAQLLQKLPDMHVLSRARPLDKMRLVRLLQEQGHVVAVTGDGTNDAPALNHANVGLAMGKTGTAVAKEASDIILLDDSFRSIVNAVMWGRSLYLNIQRFIVFQLTINVAALGIAMLGPFIGVQLPLTVIQMLWINLIMDTFAALALATEPPSWNTMNKPPRKSTDFIVTGEMARSIFGTGLVFIIALVGYLIYAQEGGVTDRELTLCFNTFVMLQFWNLFNARRLGSTASGLTGMGENKSFLLIAAAIFLGQVAIVQFGGAIFKTEPLGIKDWAIIVGGTSIVLWWGELRRMIARSRTVPVAA